MHVRKSPTLRRFDPSWGELPMSLKIATVQTKTAYPSNSKLRPVEGWPRDFDWASAVVTEQSEGWRRQYRLVWAGGRGTGRVRVRSRGRREPGCNDPHCQLRRRGWRSLPCRLPAYPIGRDGMRDTGRFRPWRSYLCPGSVQSRKYQVTKGDMVWGLKVEFRFKISNDLLMFLVKFNLKVQLNFFGVLLCSV